MDISIRKRRFEGKLLRVAFRLGVLFVFSALFQSFDLTFGGNFLAQPLRAIVFNIVFIGYGYLVWEGALRIVLLIERRTKQMTVGKRLSLLVASLLSYGILGAYLFGFTYGISDILFFQRYEAWESFSRFSYELLVGIFLFYLLILAFNGVIFYYRQWNEYQIKTERLMRENIQARYEALMNQIEPHFFFNSLSVLTNLVYKSPDLSATYITRLAQCYRYILDKKMENLISIDSELEFLDSYMFLIKVRHQDSIIMNIDIPKEVRQSRMIPPASLQMLIENAIKHNRFSSVQSLCININYNSDRLIVSNTLNRRVASHGSTGTGLENIRKRYELYGSGVVEVLEADGQFIVKLPTIKRDGLAHL